MHNRIRRRGLWLILSISVLPSVVLFSLWMLSPTQIKQILADKQQPFTSMSITVTRTYSTTLPRFSHIFIIVLENKGASQISGNPDAPYLNSLATQYARADNYRAIQHPSLPNYLALTGGATFGIHENCLDCFLNQDNLAHQLEQAGRSWNAYMEAMPAPCYMGNARPLYYQKHNPFIYYDNIRNDSQLCHKIVPLTKLESDLQANVVPDFVWITPDMCSDMHNCSIKQGDSWLQKWVPKLLASPAWQTNGVLFITFDESSGNCCTSDGGQVYTLVISPLVRSGFVSNTAYTHYSLLRTIEESWHLPLLGSAGCDCTTPMTEFFLKPH